MQKSVIEYLSKTTEEEQYILVQENPSHRSFYAKPGRFIIERRHISNLSFGESTAPICMRPHPRFREFPVHSHDFIEMMYVCSGSITHVFGNLEVTLNTNDLIILGRETKHSILSAGQNDIGINLIISTDLFETLLNALRTQSRLSTQTLESLLNRGGLPFFVFNSSDSVAVQNLMDSMISSFIFEKNADGYILRQSLNLLLCYLCGLSGDGAGAALDNYEEALKKKIMNYIQTSYSTATLSEAAQMMGLSAPYLSRLICQAFGKNFKTLLMEARFSAACELLCSTRMPVGEIINQVGYENNSFFHKEFKRRYGMTPNSYRKSGTSNQ